MGYGENMITTAQTSAQESAVSPAVKQPLNIGERYWVQCPGFRCMAVADHNGKWKVFPTGKELTSSVLSFWQ
jgi:hypothetical protein